MNLFQASIWEVHYEFERMCARDMFGELSQEQNLITSWDAIKDSLNFSRLRYAHRFGQVLLAGRFPALPPSDLSSLSNHLRPTTHYHLQLQ